MRCLAKIMLLSICCVLLAGCAFADHTTPEKQEVLPNILIPGRGTWCKTYSEYLAYVDQSYLRGTDDLVVYETISQLGEFQHFYIESLAENCEKLYYWYELTDEAGYSIAYWMDDRRQLDLSGARALSDADVNLADMRLVNDEAVSVYSFGNLHYVYYAGRLGSIKWVHNGKYCYLSADFWEHPLDSTGIGQLINIEGKTEAELMAIIGNDSGNKSAFFDYKGSVILLATVITVLLCTSGLLVYTKRRKKSM